MGAFHRGNYLQGNYLQCKVPTCGLSSETVFGGLFSEETVEVNFYEFFQNLTTYVSLGV